MSLKNILLVALLSAPLFSQIQTARIAGIVYDPNRAVIPGASLTLTNKNTNVAQKVASDGSGNYVISGLYPGTYDISALSPGFRTLRRNGIEIQVGKDLQLDLELSIGESSSVIEVTAELPLLNSESGAVSHVMTNQQIVDLPLNGRGFNELARLTPGVVLLPGTGNVTRIRPEFFTCGMCGDFTASNGCQRYEAMNFWNSLSRAPARASSSLLGKSLLSPGLCPSNSSSSLETPSPSLSSVAINSRRREMSKPFPACFNSWPKSRKRWPNGLCGNSSKSCAVSTGNK